jgi:hypothetical protein
MEAMLPSLLNRRGNCLVLPECGDRSINHLKLAIATAPFILLATPCQAAHQRVLVVHSYHETQQNHVVPMTEGILKAPEGMDLDIRYYYMDTRRRDSEEWKQQAGQEARQLVKDFQPDLVMAMDDNAQHSIVRSPPAAGSAWSSTSSSCWRST